MRLIDADVLKADYGMKDDCADCEKELQGKVRSCEYDYIYSKMDFCRWIDDTPTIEPPTTEWLGNHTPFRCKRCGHYSDSRTPYCAYCGKKVTNVANS